MKANPPGKAVLLTLLTVASSLPASAGPIWYSRFETENGVAVMDGQSISTTANSIDTETGGTRGTAVNLAGSYIASAIPAAVDPLSVAGGFAVESVNDSNWYIDTLVPSDTPTAASEVTMEGFFNLQGDVTAPNVHHRIVSQKRSGGTFNNGRVVVAIEYNPTLGGPVFGTTYTLGTPYEYPVAMGQTLLRKGDWHHFAVVVDLDEATNTSSIRGYLDGVLEFDTGPIPASPDGKPLTGSGPQDFSLGGGTSSSLVAFKGYLDEVRISSGVLAPSQFLIPEPATLLLLAAGAVLVRRSRRTT